MARFLKWAMPGLIFSVSFAVAACTDGRVGNGGFALCPTGGTGGNSGSGGATGEGGTDGGTIGPGDIAGGTTGNEKGAFQNNTFDHANDPGSLGQQDPFQIAAQNAQQGPPEVRTRLHSCSKIPYATLGTFLTTHGVNLANTNNGMQPMTAGDLYNGGGDALGAAHFDTRDGESYFLTTAGATKLFDIFVQAAPEMIANLTDATKAPACQVGGSAMPLFDPNDGACVGDAFACIMGRPVTSDDLALCNLMLQQATPNDPASLANTQIITVATFLSAAHTCE